MFHAILVIAISLQTYGQEYFMNEEVSGMYNITSSHLYENCNLKLSKYFAHVVAESIQKLAKKSATANNLCYLLPPSDSISSLEIVYFPFALFYWIHLKWREHFQAEFPKQLSMSVVQEG